MQSIDSPLYWRLPGPRAFIHKISSRIISTRVLVINLPLNRVPGTYEGIAHGLHDAHLGNPIRLDVYENQDVASLVGFHFTEKSGRMTAAQMADHVHKSPITIVLHPKGDGGQTLCDEYSAEFMQAVHHCHGNVRLVTSIHNESLLKDSKVDSAEVITFDGGLSQDEMEAYVALRMADRPGPGSTRLLRAIVSEYAGFDALFAERLMSLDDSQILGIRDNLGLLMGEDHERWRNFSWLSGTKSIGSKCPHVLHESYLAEHGSTFQKSTATDSINRRYWRACLKVISPWLEERRIEVMRYFMPQLNAISKASPDGKIHVPAGLDRSGNVKTRPVDPDDIEMNNIVGMERNGQISAITRDQQAALGVCKSTKSVRDEIFHLRAPKSDDLTTLIHRMDALITE